MMTPRLAALSAILLMFARPANTHHSYAMFDGSTSRTVAGTLAKLEWINPHVFVWVYVRNAASSGGYDLYAFENGSPGILARAGWSRDVLATGERITVEYRPLRDGRNGGHFMKATRADGSVLLGVGGPGTGVSAPVIPPAPK